jgi:uncharacterized RDD family membrane protein YckC
MLCRNHVDVSDGVRRCARCGATFCRDCLVEIHGLPYCATCKNEQLLDVRSGVDRSTLTLAGIGKRFGAVIIDGLIVTMPIYILFWVAMLMTAQEGGEPNLFVIGPLYFLLLFAQPVYEGIMFSSKNGQTIGKSAMKVRVVRPDGSPISTGQAWGRAFGKLLFGCIWLFDYLPAFFTNDKTTLHDMVATTRVVETY